MEGEDAEQFDAVAGRALQEKIFGQSPFRRVDPLHLADLLDEKAEGYIDHRSIERSTTDRCRQRDVSDLAEQAAGQCPQGSEQAFGQGQPGSDSAAAASRSTVYMRSPGAALNLSSGAREIDGYWHMVLNCGGPDCGWRPFGLHLTWRLRGSIVFFTGGILVRRFHG